MRLLRKRSPAPTLTFPRGVDTAAELMASLGPVGQRALQAKLRTEALTDARRGR